MKEEIEKLEKSIITLNIVLIVSVFFGLVLILFGACNMIGLAEIVNEEHLSDSNLPATEYPENATFVWTFKEIQNKVETNIYLILAGLIPTTIGIVGVFIVPGKKQLHQIKCNPLAESIYKYCPDCGLKMSLLEKKEQE